MSRVQLVSIMLSALVSGCAIGDAGSTAEPTDPPQPESVRRCQDVGQIAAELVNPGVEPLAPGENPDEAVIQAIQAIGERNETSFGGVWIDRETGAVVAAFTADLAARRSELLSVSAGSLIGIARAPYPLGFLLERQDEIAAGELAGANGPIIGLGTRENLGVVALDVKVFDEPTVARIVGRHGAEAICIDGPDPEAVTSPGPQPEGGDGWRLLIDRPGAGRPWATGFAESAGELAALWDEVGLRSPIPEVDFSTEVVIWFGPAVSGSCRNIRLDAVDIDLEQQTVIPEIVLPGGAAICTADANPHAYLVAVERDRLPARPFTVELLEDACEVAPGVCEEQRTTVD